MDAPEETNGLPISKFEDSPVFSYISELSPIKPVRPVHHTQTLSSLSFQSPPPVFTSPIVNYHREFRILQSSSHNLSSEYGTQITSSEAVRSYTNVQVSRAYYNSGERQDNFGGTSYDHPTPSCDELASIFACDDQAWDAYMGGPFNQQQEIARPERHLESLIPARADQLILNSPDETEAFKGIMQEPTIQPSNFISQLPQTDQMQDLFNFTAMAINPNEEIVDKHFSITHHKMLRRSLDFEMAGIQRKNSYGGSNTSSSALQSYKRNVPNERRLVPATSNVNSQGSILPGTDSDFNGLATLKDYRMVTNGGLPYMRQLNLSNSASSLNLSANRKGHQISSMGTIPERDLDSQDIWTKLAKDCSLPSAHIVGEGLNQNSPERKRRKVEPVGGGEGCRNCKCKKSKCLKLYCECFAAGVYCMGPCSCQDCSNKPIHEHIVLTTRQQIESRNPLAFAPKVIKNANSLPEIWDNPHKTPASARHRRGCNCKKSGCLKKYCECYQGGVGCTISCRCGVCKNVYGSKNV